MASNNNNNAAPKSLAHVTETVAFIGGGNMAEAIIGGVLSSGFPASQLVVSEPFQPRLDYLRATYPNIVLTDDSLSAVAGGLPVPNSDNAKARSADVIILAVKPNVVRQVAEALAPAVKKAKSVVVSIAAGIRTDDLVRWLAVVHEDEAEEKRRTESGADRYEPTVVRCMPNTPALVQEGATGLYAAPTVSDKQREITATLLGAVSETVWVDNDSLLDTVTGISGSGPAYFFLILEALEDAGVHAGLSREVAGKLAVKTCAGAAKMASESPDSFAELRRKVTSPNGTTHAAIQTLMNGGIKELVAKAVNAAKERGHDLGIEYGKL